MKIYLRESELAESFMGTGAQVWIRVQGASVIAKADNLPIRRKDTSSLALHNENGSLKLEDCEGHIHLKTRTAPPS